MNKFLCTLYIVPLSFLLTGCWTTIRTVSEPVVVVREAKPTPPPTQVTTVITPTPKVTTVTTFVATDYNTDLSFYLDLNAVAAVFAESRSTREFEQILNSSRYMINNLDLNRDGWVDYLRVIETRQGFYHAYLIQSCIAPGLFQDVATLVAERQANTLYVEVIGDPYLYGYNYIVRPVFVKTPPIWDIYGRPTYTVWSSPYYYGYYPSYYTQPKPVYLNHYQAYVTTYLTNHHYCHRCDYPSKPFYSGYTQMTESYRRADYQNQHPDDSFERRVTRNASQVGKSVRNTAQLRAEVEKSNARTSATTSSSDKSGTSTSSRSTATSTKPTTTTTSSSRSGAQSGTTTSSSRTSTQSGTSTSSRSTATSTRATTTTSSSRSGAQSGTTTSSSRTSTQSGTSTSSSRTSSSATSARTTTPVTTVSTRVNKSGTTRTTVKTTDSTGRTTTVKRESGSATRSTGTSTRSTGTTRSSSTGTSSRSSQGTTDESNPRSSQRAR